MSPATRRFFADAAERAARTFAQAYFACWLAIEPAFDRLFTLDNVKAGVVGLALSLAMSVGVARQAGANDSASFLPADVDPPQPEQGATDLGFAAAVALFAALAVYVLLDLTDKI